MALYNNIEYEFYFSSGNFDQVIYDRYINSNDLKLQIKIIEIVNNIKNVLININGLHVFSTFLEYNNLKFKITLLN